MSPNNVCLWLFLFSTLCELGLCKEEMVASDVTGSIAKIMKRQSNKAFTGNRIRRSYLDNRVDTFPEHPVYYHNKHHHDHHDPFMQRNFPSFASETTREGRYYSPEPDYPFNSGPLDLSAFDGLINERDLGLPKQPIPAGTDDLDLLGGNSFDGILGNLDFLGEPSPQKMGDLGPRESTSGQEAMTQEANSIMDDFLEYMTLRESGALDECLGRKK